MKKKKLGNLKLKKRTISHLKTNDLKGGTLGLICLTIYSYFQCDDITHTSKDHDGVKCDIATVNDSCFTLCDDMCNDF